jgi:hypothetical protein
MSESISVEKPRNEIDELLGPPPVMRGEDLDRYRRLQAAVEHEIKPEGIFDQIFVRELADKLWQQQRYRKTIVAITESSYVEALASLLRIYQPPGGLLRMAEMMADEDKATRLAREYYSGDTSAKRMKELNAELKMYNISPEQIEAKALEQSSGRVTALIRMEANAENSLRLLRKENAGRLAAKAKEARQSADGSVARDGQREADSR